MRLAGTTVIVATHWNSPGLGAVSSTESWVAYVAARLPNRVLGNTNHVHRNAVESPHVTSSGQNGMRDWGSPARECRGSQCCPTLWSGAWKLGGWSRGRVCGDLFGATAQVEAINGSYDAVYTREPPFLSDPVLAAVRSTRLYAMGAFGGLYMGGSEHGWAGPRDTSRVERAQILKFAGNLNRRVRATVEHARR